MILGFGTAQDHKRAFENDKGQILVVWELILAPIIDKIKKIISKIIKPTLNALKRKKIL